jgi:hypothetical protein
MSPQPHDDMKIMAHRKRRNKPSFVHLDDFRFFEGPGSDDSHGGIEVELT